MGMFDTIESEQVKCFECELNHYKIGDAVPCGVFSYNSNLLIMPFDTFLADYWYSESFVIIKDSKVYQLKTIRDLKEYDFVDINEVITYMGDRIKINNKNELINYIEDIMILKVKNDISDFRRIYNDDYYYEFEKKWKGDVNNGFNR